MPKFSVRTDKGNEAVEAQMYRIDAPAGVVNFIDNPKSAQVKQVATFSLAHLICIIQEDAK